MAKLVRDNGTRLATGFLSTPDLLPMLAEHGHLDVPHESLNHYSKGAVISFMHRYVAGLVRLEPTWRRFLVQPRPGGGITWASASHETPHGLAAVSWTLSDGFEMTVTVPPGCVADVVLPDGTTHEVGPGTVTLR